MTNTALEAIASSSGNKVGKDVSAKFAVIVCQTYRDYCDALTSWRTTGNEKRKQEIRQLVGPSERAHIQPQTIKLDDRG